MKETKEHRLPVLAIDLGGTKIIAAIIANPGQVMAKKRHPTLANKGPQSVIERLFSAVNDVLSLNNMNPSQLDSISIASAGAIDADKGIVTSSPNLPGWQGVPLRDIIKEEYKVDAFLINDASAAALAEYHFGAGKGVKNLIYLTVSTGIGGGIIIDGQLYTGPSGSAGEIGHTTIDINGPKCSCGNTGCLEVLASGTAMAREAIRRLKQGEASSLTELVAGKLENITAEKVSLAAERGDRLAQEVISQAAISLGVGMANLVNIFNPQMIIVGGGVAKMGDRLLNPAREVVRERAFQLPAQAVRIVQAKLGDNAGLLGAALFALQQR